MESKLVLSKKAESNVFEHQRLKDVLGLREMLDAVCDSSGIKANSGPCRLYSLRTPAVHFHCQSKLKCKGESLEICASEVLELR